MSERWVPILAAVVGLLGGMAGAYVGGSVANEGQRQRLESERQSEIQDLRMATYTRYLRELASWGETSTGRVQAAQAEVFLIASSEALREAAADLYDAVQREDEPAISRARRRFVALAQHDIER